MTWVSRSPWLTHLPEPYDLFGLPNPVDAAPDPRWWSIVEQEDAICLGILDRAIGTFVASELPERISALFEAQPPIEQRWIGNMN
jgi:hypothetical protein